MQMLKNLINSDEKYYLELDEEQDSQAVASPTETVSKAINTVQEKTEKVTNSQPENKTVKTDPEQLTSVVTEEKQSPAKPVAAKSEKKASPTKATSQNSGASSFDPPFWVAAMYNSNGSAANNGSNTNGNSTSESETFATNNLMPVPTTYRRRPGGSLNKFKDMAKTVRTGRR